MLIAKTETPVNSVITRRAVNAPRMARPPMQRQAGRRQAAEQEHQQDEQRGQGQRLRSADVSGHLVAHVAIDCRQAAHLFGEPRRIELLRDDVQLRWTGTLVGFTQLQHSVGRAVIDTHQIRRPGRIAGQHFGHHAKRQGIECVCHRAPEGGVVHRHLGTAVQHDHVGSSRPNASSRIVLARAVTALLLETSALELGKHSGAPEQGKHHEGCGGGEHQPATLIGQPTQSIEHAWTPTEKSSRGTDRLSVPVLALNPCRASCTCRRPVVPALQNHQCPA